MTRGSSAGTSYPCATVGTKHEMIRDIHTEEKNRLHLHLFRRPSPASSDGNLRRP